MNHSLSFAIKFAAGLAIVASVSGCSILDIGEPNYSCSGMRSGMPEGVQCMSTRDVYNLTNDGYVPNAMNDGATQTTGQAAETESSGSVGRAELDPNDVVSNYVAPRLPDQPVPIRTPAQVMRVWIAPWEDDRGDLIVTGHLYTEVEPRRWVIGEQAANTQPSLRPLQSIQQSSED